MQDCSSGSLQAGLLRLLHTGVLHVVLCQEAVFAISTVRSPEWMITSGLKVEDPISDVTGRISTKAG